MRPIINIDCDGPCSNFTKKYLAALEAETGAKHGPEEVEQWNIAACDFFGQAAMKINVDRAVLKQRVDAHVLRPGFCAEMEVMPGAREAIAQLEAIGDVYIVTSPWDSSPTWQHERLHWVAREFRLPRSRVIQAGVKTHIFGHVFADDKPSHVTAWAKQWPESEAFLFEMHHNRAEARAAGMVLTDWPDIIEAAERAARRL